MNTRRSKIFGQSLLLLIVMACSGESDISHTVEMEPTLYPTPGRSSDISINPGDNWQLVVDSWPDGTTFTVKAGVHRLVEVSPKHGNTFVGERGAIMNGSKLLTAFQREANYWVTNAELSSRGLVQGDCIDNYEGCRYPQDLFLDDVTLWRVTDFNRGAPGTWYLNYETNRVYMWDDPTNRK